MNPDFTKEEITILHNFLAKEMKHFYQAPIEWDFWNETCRLDEMDIILKKLERCLKKH